MGKATILPHPKPPNVKDLTGYVYHDLTIIQFAGLDKHNNKYWHAKCACGVVKVVAGQHLPSGRIRSCGCYARRLNSQRRLTHGESNSTGNTPEYSAYSRARQRCTNPANKSFADYGDRGIEFRFTSFEEFLQAVGRRPSPKHSLDRIDNDGHYEKGNLRWATRLEQAGNQRRSVLITANGHTHCLHRWAVLLSVSEGTLRHRLESQWCHNCVINLPVRGGRCPHKSSISQTS